MERLDRSFFCRDPADAARAIIGATCHGTAFLDGGSTGIVSGIARGIVASTRVGTSRGREIPWRFAEAGSGYVSGRINR